MAGATRLQRIRPTTFVDDVLAVAMAWIATGRPDAAIDVLERALPERGLFLSYCFSWSEFDPIRTDPRFQRLVEESRPK